MFKLMYTRKVSIVSLVLFLLIAGSCEKDKDILTIPTIPESIIFSLGSNAVTVSGILSNDGGSEVTAQGICWSTIPEPTVSGNKIDGDLSDETIFCRIQELTPSTKYYARVYATNSIGTAYSNEITFTTNAVVSDIDGNIYNTVTIGTQTWMVENLKTTRYSDGIEIPIITANSEWVDLNSPIYCWYDNNIANKYIYGALYNWPTVNSGKLCPIGWHVPSDTEWTTLTNNLGGNDEAGGLLKEMGHHWASPNFAANNYSGFTAFPGGIAVASDPTFSGIKMRGAWWTSTIDENEYNIYMAMFFDTNKIDRNGFVSRANALNALSIRCIKD